MEIGLREKGDVVIVDLAGRLVAGDGEQALRAIVDRLVGEKHQKILLNLAKVTALDSSGLGELVASKKLTEKFGGRVKLLEATDRVAHVLEASLILPVFEHFTEESAAVRSFG
jgi:anti-sigma B factor antagonist